MSFLDPCPAKRLGVCWTWTCLRTSFTAMANGRYWPKSPGREVDRSPTGARPQPRVPQKVSSKSIAGLPHRFSPNSSRCSRVGLKRSSLRLTAWARCCSATVRLRGTEYPQPENFGVQSVLTPPSEEKMLEAFTSVELTP